MVLVIFGTTITLLAVAKFIICPLASGAIAAVSGAMAHKALETGCAANSAKISQQLSKRMDDMRSIMEKLHYEGVFEHQRNSLEEKLHTLEYLWMAMCEIKVVEESVKKMKEISPRKSKQSDTWKNKWKNKWKDIISEDSKNQKLDSSQKSTIDLTKFSSLGEIMLKIHRAVTGGAAGSKGILQYCYESSGSVKDCHRLFQILFHFQFLGTFMQVLIDIYDGRDCAPRMETAQQRISEELAVAKKFGVHLDITTEKVFHSFVPVFEDFEWSSDRDTSLIVSHDQRSVWKEYKIFRSPLKFCYGNTFWSEGRHALQILVHPLRTSDFRIGIGICLGHGLMNDWVNFVEYTGEEIYAGQAKEYLFGPEKNDGLMPKNLIVEKISIYVCINGGTYSFNCGVSGKTAENEFISIGFPLLLNGHLPRGFKHFQPFVYLNNSYCRVQISPDSRKLEFSWDCNNCHCRNTEEMVICVSCGTKKNSGGEVDQKDYNDITGDDLVSKGSVETLLDGYISQMTELQKAEGVISWTNVLKQARILSEKNQPKNEILCPMSHRLREAKANVICDSCFAELNSSYHCGACQWDICQSCANMVFKSLANRTPFRRILGSDTIYNRQTVYIYFPYEDQWLTTSEYMNASKGGYKCYAVVGEQFKAQMFTIRKCYTHVGDSKNGEQVPIESKQHFYVQYGEQVLTKPFFKRLLFDDIYETFYVTQEWYVEECGPLRFGVSYKLTNNTSGKESGYLTMEHGKAFTRIDAIGAVIQFRRDKE